VFLLLVKGLLLINFSAGRRFSDPGDLDKTITKIVGNKGYFRHKATDGVQFTH